MLHSGMIRTQKFENRAINRALWTLTEEMRKLKAA